MEILVSAILIIVAAGFVALPFLNPEEAQPQAAAATLVTARGEAEKRKNEAYAVIKEAEFDLKMGKLSEADFQAIRGKYAAQALAAISTLTTASAEGSNPRPGSIRRGRVAYCPSCGTAVGKGANFCAGCGNDLRRIAA